MPWELLTVLHTHSDLVLCLVLELKGIAAHESLLGYENQRPGGVQGPWASQFHAPPRPIPEPLSSEYRRNVVLPWACDDFETAFLNLPGRVVVCTASLADLYAPPSLLCRILRLSLARRAIVDS
ncbi:hypothetical protein C8R46DRAFT_356639 [Mycena filopes]|nr:hypothetical protein C8R46DRAFT_356639 [Mycena filopes]